MRPNKCLERNRDLIGGISLQDVLSAISASKRDLHNLKSSHNMVVLKA